MKKVFLLFSILIVIALLGAPLQQVFADGGILPPSEPEFIEQEEFEARWNASQELTAVDECILPQPGFEGDLHNMTAYEDTTRTQACIDNYFVKAITYSAWRGSPTTANLYQHYKAYWRLLDADTNKILRSMRIDLLNNPKVSGPPSLLFKEWRHCGPAKNYLLLLDTSARQIINGVETGLTNRDHSWRFSFPAVPCKLFLPLIFKAPKPILGCPVDRWAKLKVEENEWWAHLGNPADVIGSPAKPLLVGGVGYKLTLSYRTGSTPATAVVQALPANGRTMLCFNGNCKDYGTGPFIDFWGGVELIGVNVYELHGEFTAENGEICSFTTWVKDPPAGVQTLMASASSEEVALAIFNAFAEAYYSGMSDEESLQAANLIFSQISAP